MITVPRREELNMVPEALRTALSGDDRLVIAVSGGIDSLTLAAAAASARTPGLTVLCHARSPAVPAEALSRVQDMAARTGLPLHLVEAGEFSDPAYRANPVDRCYFCKGHLYATLSRLGGAVAAGTNLDDLADYRPGLKAAAQHGVRHPFVEAGMNKAAVRALARALGLGALAELPASPCLASRVRTGLRIEPEALLLIDRIEMALRERLGPVDLRCRQEETGLTIEIDARVLEALTTSERAALATLAGQMAGGQEVPLRPYRKGSAFVHV